jgi:hypothetical protein
VDGAIGDWLAHRDLDREQLLGALHGSVTAPGARPDALS